MQSTFSVLLNSAPSRSDHDLLPGSPVPTDEATVSQACPDRFFAGVSRLGPESGNSVETPYRCPRCDKRFARLDHVKRHLQSHENSRSHQCHLCMKKFNRKDLLDRHITIHEPRSGLSEKSRKRKDRAAKACHWCIVAKTKCSDERPCERCQQRALPCDIHGEPTTPPSLSSFTVTSVGNELLSNNDPSLPTINHVLDQSESIGPSIQPTGYEDDLHMNGGGSLSTQTGNRDGESSSSALQPQLPDTTQTRQDWNMSGDLNEVPYLLEYDFSFDYDVSNLFAMDLDWNALVEPSFAPPSEFTSVSGDNQNQDVSRAPPTSRAVLGHEAFKRSPWVWQADSHDSADVEEAPHLSKAQEKLLLPRFLLDRNSVTSMAIPPTMGDSARDAILLLVQRNSGPTTTVQSFPSVQTLNFLLMNFLFREKDEGCPFIHMPSLVPDKCRPELLTAMIAAGAVTVGIDQIWRLGLAFQERTRMALFHAMDTDSSLPRNLDVVRASLLWIETGLWCGSGRKMEVADSAANNMLRRAGVLYAGFYETETAPLTSDNGDVLKTKWLKWVKLESFKRLALRALMSDVQSAMASMRSTTFSSTDINFALPASRDLWDASSARKWKTLVLAKKDSLETTPTLTLMDIIQDPWKLRTCGDNYDRVLSITAALYCLWPQVASFLDSRALQRSLTTADKPPASSSPMWLEAQRQDLYQRLSSLRELARSIDSLTADVHMACELFSMSLFVSPIDTQKFVGRCGAEESQVVAPSLQYWAESDERRYAMWHAGQVLRAARNMIPAHIQGFRAISVYQACLTLALPHLLSGSGRQPLVRSGEMMMERDMTGGNQQTTASALPCSTDVMTTGKLVILNDEEGIQSKSYLSSRGGHQTPALLVSGGRVQPISNVEMIANTMAGIFRDNHRRGSSSTTNNSTLPPLLERLIALLTELSKAT